MVHHTDSLFRSETSISVRVRFIAPQGVKPDFSPRYAGVNPNGLRKEFPVVSTTQVNKFINKLK
jgi:hypothetical protein